MRTFDKPTKIFVPVLFSHNDENWIRNEGPHFFETYITDASFQNAKKRLDGRDGKKAIVELEPFDECGDIGDFNDITMVMAERDCIRSSFGSLILEKFGLANTFESLALTNGEHPVFGRLKVMQVKRVIYL